MTVRRLDHEHLIVIRDNGRGFDPSAVKADTGTHIGIENVRNRLDGMCSGRLDIDSTIGEGTTITLHIPIKKDGI